jgi:hypothetical protein
MSTTTHQQARIKELQRRRALQRNPNGVSILTPDNFEILLTVESVTTIANKVSEIIGEKMSRTEVDSLIQFVSMLPPDRYYTQSLMEAQDKIAAQFLNKMPAMAKHFSDESDLEHRLGIDDITDGPGTLREYQKMELDQLTKNENQLKYTSFQNRRGNAMVDRNRVEGDYSSPDSIKPSHKITDADVQKALFEGMGMVKRFLDPESIDDMFNSFRQVWTTFATVSLPHQTIPLDSRNRLLNHNEVGEYKWYIHAAGVPGQLGNLRIQDTLQEVIKMRVCPFWIPVNDVMDDYYGKVRLLIKEFQSQSIQVTQFLDSQECEPTVQNYHFEFEIERRDKNKLYLIPCNPDYIFRKPFARVETITTCFFSPYDFIDLDADRVVCTVNDANPAQFTSSQPHNLATGDLVYVLDYDSGIQSLNTAMNRTKGYIATKIDDVNFTIEVDTTAAGGDVTNVHCILGSKRIFLEIEFTSLEE